MKNKKNFLLRDIISDESKTDNEEKKKNTKKRKSSKRSNVTVSFFNQTERQDISERKNLIDNQNVFSEIENKKNFKHSKIKVIQYLLIQKIHLSLVVTNLMIQIKNHKKIKEIVN